MSDNPLQPLINTCSSLSRSLQTHLSQFLIAPDSTTTNVTMTNNSLSSNPLRPFSSFSLGAETIAVAASPIKDKETKPLTKEELGRCTWTLLHSIAAQYPDKPTRQQRRDAKELVYQMVDLGLFVPVESRCILDCSPSKRTTELMAILSRMYPCKDCQDHFKEILKANPVQVGQKSSHNGYVISITSLIEALAKYLFLVKE